MNATEEKEHDQESFLGASLELHRSNVPHTVKLPYHFPRDGGLFQRRRSEMVRSWRIIKAGRLARQFTKTPVQTLIRTRYPWKRAPIPLFALVQPWQE